MNLERIIVLVCLAIMIALGSILGVTRAKHKKQAREYRLEIRKWRGIVDRYLHTPAKKETLLVYLEGKSDTIYYPVEITVPGNEPVNVLKDSSCHEQIFSQVVTTKDFKAHVMIGACGKLTFLKVPEYMITAPKEIITLPPIRIDSLIFDTIEIAKSHFGAFGGLAANNFSAFPALEAGIWYEYKNRWGLEAGAMMIDHKWYGTLRARVTIR